MNCRGLGAAFLLQDTRHGFRVLLKAPSFMVATLFALSLGIGANTAIFSVVNAVVFRPLPYKNPEKLMMIWEIDRQKGRNVLVSPQDFRELRSQNQDFEEIAAFVSGAEITFDLTGRGQPERLRGAIVSARLMPLLGVRPLIGRNFSPQEDSPGGDQVVLLSHRVWQRHFGGDSSALGKTVTLNGKVYTVMGVLPSWFEFPRGVDLWLPGPSRTDEFLNLGFHAFPYYRVMGRLKPGVTVRKAQADMEAIARQRRPGRRRAPRFERPDVHAGGRSEPRAGRYHATANGGPAWPGPMGMHAEWGRLRTDGTWHTTYWIAEWPRTDVGADFLGPLLLASDFRRSVSVVMEPVSPLRAARPDRAGADRRHRRRRAAPAQRFPGHDAQLRREEEVLVQREDELATGHASFRFSGYVTVSTPDTEALDEACGRVEQIAGQSGLELRRCYGDQAVAFTCTLPLGRGLA